MTQVGEAVGFAIITDLIVECPFQTPEPPAVKVEAENVAKDDKGQPPNDGGVLGKNIVSGSPGAGGTWNPLGADPPKYQWNQIDTGRTGDKVTVRNDAGTYDFTVAAHHLLPGNASLYASDLFKKFMKKGGQVKVKVGGQDMTFTLLEHIGYNVNGSHNGVWLPGSYAITKNHSPVKNTGWGSLWANPKQRDWCVDYMASVVKKSGGQFHNTHTLYNRHVKGILNKLSIKIVSHLSACEKCQQKKKIPPPYVLKGRLYRLSWYLRVQTLSPPRLWKSSLMTADTIRAKRRDPIWWPSFLKAFEEAKP